MWVPREEEVQRSVDERIPPLVFIIGLSLDDMVQRRRLNANGPHNVSYFLIRYMTHRVVKQYRNEIQLREEVEHLDGGHEARVN